MDELTAWLVLVRAPGLHAGTFSPLFTHFGSAHALVTASPAALRDASADPALIDYLLHRAVQPVADLRWLERDRHHLVTWQSPLYPPLLAQLRDAPIALYARGDPQLLTLPQLAIVGSRNPTPAGRENARSFATHLGECGLTITSGLAIGIDAASHEGALATAGRTIAVCGTGLDIIYPKTNIALAESIADRGALISEFPLGAGPFKSHFPRRNRVIAGLSLGTLVVEAAVQSGSLITARLAADAGREVFAIPGSIHNPMARGCHRLIRQGATLVESAADIFAELRPLAEVLLRSVPMTKALEPQGNSSSPLDKEYEILLDALGFEPAGVDLLVERTGLRADEVASMLLILELENRIASYPGGLYVRARPEGMK
ncbi:MAG: DNA-processing protein DprA [Steroidobacteraceae bacterium]